MASMVAAGNIVPSRFVKLDSSNPGQVLQAGAGDKPYGVAQQGVRNTPYSTLDDGYAAISGENLRVYENDEICLLESGGVISHGDRLKPSTGGVAITTVTDKDSYGAIALQPASKSGVLIKARVVTAADISA